MRTVGRLERALGVVVSTMAPMDHEAFRVSRETVGAVAGSTYEHPRCRRRQRLEEFVDALRA